MIVLGSLAPDTHLEQLIAEASDAESALASEARDAQDREWLFDLGPALFATYTQSAINAANLVARIADKISADRTHAALLVREAARALDAERASITALDARVRDYASRHPSPAAARMSAASAAIVETWERMVANLEQIDPTAAPDALAVRASRDRWEELARKIGGLQRGV